MTESTPFEPNEVEVRSATDRHDVTLIFRSDNGESREVAAPRTTIPGLIARLVAEIGPGQGVPIAGSLRPGQTIVVQGFAGHRLPDGGAALTLFVHLPDEGREVTIPLELSADDVLALIQMIGEEKAT